MEHRLCMEHQREHVQGKLDSAPRRQRKKTRAENEEGKVIDIVPQITETLWFSPVWGAWAETKITDRGEIFNSENILH